MLFTETSLPGAYVIDLDRREDERGFFARAWCRREFETHGLDAELVQCNLSSNPRAGTLRGMHYQVPPDAETKLVRCVRGAIFDAIVDVRVDSSTFGEWLGVELSAENGRMLYVPEGFAHGFETLVDGTDVYYQVSAYYAPGAEQGLRWDDPAVAIEWPLPPTIISRKDASWPGLRSISAVEHVGEGRQ
jgi:dTDP-4-dehydrorhamnose 3,5-epimerase